jgi:hypothetical protein
MSALRPAPRKLLPVSVPLTTSSAKPRIWISTGRSSIRSSVVAWARGAGIDLAHTTPYSSLVKARGSFVLALAWLVVAQACGRDDAVSPDFGATCMEQGDCSSGARCLPNPGWPNGFCTQDCDVDTDCPSSAICIDTPNDGLACLFECNDPRDCEFLDREGEQGSWTCTEFTSGPMARFACAGQ